MRLADLAVPAYVGRRTKFVLVVVDILLMWLSRTPMESAARPEHALAYLTRLSTFGGKTMEIAGVFADMSLIYPSLIHQRI